MSVAFGNWSVIEPMYSVRGLLGFYNSAGECVLVIDGSSVRRCCQLVPTLDGLGDFGTALPRLIELGILPQDASP
ncbi:hypothetical protein ABH935_008613 [Catenulispora sp. GAS73]|uniref:hypothetical protein n=1 Tax=Catenulispora sp. GAS73 TaxID=3156269 RepID=UPI003514C05E